MTYEKNQQHFKFTRPESDTRRVLTAVEQGHDTSSKIETKLKLPKGKVKHALKNLCTLGAIVREIDFQGRSVFLVPGSRIVVAGNVKGVRSIFDVLPK